MCEDIYYIDIALLRDKQIVFFALPDKRMNQWYFLSLSLTHIIITIVIMHL
jgi:hypothetical protein